MKTVEEAKALISKVSFITNIIFYPHSDSVFQILSVFLNHYQKQVQANVCVTMEMVKEALDQLKGAVMIVYPMGLPPHDPIRMEFEDREELSGTQVSSRTCYHKHSLLKLLFFFWQSWLCLPCLLVNLFLSSFSLHLPSSVTVHQASLQVIRQDECQLWWAAKEMQRGKKLQDYTGKNEKTKLVVKIQKVRANSVKE